MAKHFQLFGSGAAFTVEPVDNAKGSVKTFNLELSPVRDRKPIHEEKFIVQPTLSELSLLACVLTGLIPIYDVRRNGKWIFFERQTTTGNLFIKGGLRNVLALPVSAGDGFVLADIVLGRLAENLKAPSMLEHNLKSTAKLYLGK